MARQLPISNIPRVEVRDPKEVRRLVEKDGLFLPLSFEEEKKLDKKAPCDIQEVARRVQLNISSQFVAMDEEIFFMRNRQSTRDVTFDDYESTWRPSKWGYKGDKPRKTRRPFKNFLRTTFHLKGIKSDEELQAEERAIQEILTRNPDQEIQIYSMTSLLGYLAAPIGVSASPKEILTNLSFSEVARAYNNYKGTRKSHVKELVGTKKVMVIKYLDKCLADSDWINKKIKEREIIEGTDVETKRRQVMSDTLLLKATVKKAYRDIKNHLWELVRAFHNFKLMHDDCYHHLVDYLMMLIPNLCKLNPTRPPEKTCC